jgi:hypothetical protein
MPVYQIGYVVKRKMPLVYPPGPVVGDKQKMPEFGGIHRGVSDLLAAVEAQKVQVMFFRKFLRNRIEPLGTAEPGFFKKEI